METRFWARRIQRKIWGNCDWCPGFSSGLQRKPEHEISAARELSFLCFARGGESADKGWNAGGEASPGRKWRTDSNSRNAETRQGNWLVREGIRDRASLD